MSKRPGFVTALGRFFHCEDYLAYGGRVTPGTHISPLATIQRACNIARHIAENCRHRQLLPLRLSVPATGDCPACAPRPRRIASSTPTNVSAKQISENRSPTIV